MTGTELSALLNRPVRLSFHDGEIVEAVLLGIDEQRARDITYEVTRIVSAGTPPARGTSVGATCVAALDDVASWRQP